MWRMVICAGLFLLTAALSVGQNADYMECVMNLSGVSDPDELDEDTVERFSELLRRPLRLNVASSASLAASGLFSRYQVAALEDYLQRTGDVWSMEELAAVDGFGKSFVRRIAPFISLDVAARGGSDEGLRIETDAVLRSGLRHVAGGGDKWNYAAKFRVFSCDVFSVSGGISRPSSAGGHYPTSYSISVEYSFRRVPARLVLGNFNARFGQGLVMWNGMTMSGLTSASSFVRNPVGITGSRSYTSDSSFTGAAFSMQEGWLKVNVFLAASGLGKLNPRPGKVALMPAVNVGWVGRKGEMSLTHYMELGPLAGAVRCGVGDMKSSVDMRWCLSGTDIFSEFAFDWKNMEFAALGGVSVPVSEDVRLSSMLRYYPAAYSATRSGSARSLTRPENEYAMTVAGDFALSSGDGRVHDGSFSIDAAHFPFRKKGDSGKSIQLKSVLQWNVKFSERLMFLSKLLFRYRTWDAPVRTEARLEFRSEPGAFRLAVRLHGLYCRAFSALGYVEGGYVSKDISCYLRQGIFIVDDYDDRIYVYERDAVGSFNVPAYYGRGLWTAATLSWKAFGWGKLFLRAAYTTFPFMAREKRKPDKVELRIQMNLSF